MSVRAWIVVGCLGVAGSLPAQERPDPEVGRTMLRSIRDQLRHHYYDPGLRGVNIDSVFDAAAAQMSSVSTNSQMFGIIAQAMFSLDDSHTVFFPPDRVNLVRYGWRLQFVGDTAYVGAVAVGSDAWRQGVRVGDRVLAIERYRPTRREGWKLEYMLRDLSPHAAVRLTLATPQDSVRAVTVESDIEEGRWLYDMTGRRGAEDYWQLVRRWENFERDYRSEFVTVGESTLVWQLPTFVIDEEVLDDAVSRVRHHRSLVLDLRGNGGGYESALARLVGAFFHDDVTIGELQQRNTRDTLVAHGAGGHAFTGPVIVLVDSRSASASELFAATMQIQHRAVVLGDRSMGAVMGSMVYPLRVTTNHMHVWAYGVNVTVENFDMPDGRILEHVGVEPDTVMLPTTQDLAAGWDPVLSRALAILGHRVSPAAAGRMLPNVHRRDTW